MKFDSLLLKEAVVEGDGVMPPLRAEDSSSSSESEEDVEDAGYAKGKRIGSSSPPELLGQNLGDLPSAFQGFLGRESSEGLNCSLFLGLCSLLKGHTGWLSFQEAQ